MGWGAGWGAEDCFNTGKKVRNGIRCFVMWELAMFDSKMLAIESQFVTGDI
jgi:hypothetical protein